MYDQCEVKFNEFFLCEQRNRVEFYMFPGNEFFQKERQYFLVGWGEPAKLGIQLE